MAILQRASAVTPINETEFVRKTYIAGAAITAGQPVYIDDQGVAQLSSADDADTAMVHGIALRAVSPGHPVTCMIQGSVSGIDLTGLDFGDPVYLSETLPGELDDAAPVGQGAVEVIIGRVLPVGNGAPALFVNLPATW